MAETEKDVKEFIINTASSVFARYGFTKTTMNDIAAAVKKSKSSLYHYFTSKEDVFLAIIDKEYLLVQEEVARAISQEDTPQKKLLAFILTRLRTVQKLGNLFSVVKDEYLEHYSFIEKVRKRYDEGEMKIIKELLQMGIAQGVFTIKDLETTAFSIYLTMKGLEPYWISETDQTQNLNQLQNIMDIIIFGINKR
jgi:AcrR family transcriptional regulator